MIPIRRVALELLLSFCLLSEPTWAQSGASEAGTPAPAAPIPVAPIPVAPSPAAPIPVAPIPAATAPTPPPDATPAPGPTGTSTPAPAPAATAPSAKPSTAPAEAKAVAASPAVALPPARLRKATLGWDVNLEGAYGRYYADPAQRFGFARARVGVLISNDPVFYAFGLTYDWSNLADATFGVQAEAMHIESGLWVQAGGLLDTQVHPGVMGSVGWSVVGAEVQYRKFDPNDWGVVVVGKLRIPVTFIAKAFE